MDATSRKDIISMLARKEYNRLTDLSFTDRTILHTMISITYDKKDLIAWRAMEALGIMSRAIVERKGEDPVRNLIGRLLWMIRDESGGIGWSAPEIIGEIIRNNPESFSDIVSVLASFHKEEMLRPGVLWAIGRIGEVKKELVIPSVPTLLHYLKSTDPHTCGLAVWALGKIGRIISSDEAIQNLISDSRSFTVYDDGELRETTIGQLALLALDQEKTES